MTHKDNISVAILYVCTGKYICFWDEFFRSCEDHFLPATPKHYFVFTDQNFAEEHAANVTRVQQENLGWPDNTLRRFHMFLKMEDDLSKHDYLFFFNANCLFRKDISLDFLPEDNEQLLVVRHPGYVDKEPDQMPYERSRRSRGCISYGTGKDYVCGGVNGGHSKTFLRFANHARDAIDADYHAGVVAVWHDESHLNRYILDHPHVIRHAGYCYPAKWKLNEEQFIEIRDKTDYGGHAKLRTTCSASSSDDLVTVAIFGGLGNQLFQYAAGLAYAKRTNRRLQLDTRHYDSKSLFPYSLGDFCIDALIGTSRTLPPRKADNFKYLTWRLFGRSPRLLREKGLMYDARLGSDQGSVYLHGYWQSEKYFVEYEDLIRSHLEFRLPSSTQTSRIITEIGAKPSIAVHVRRGDYVSNRKADALYGTCSPDYYQDAVSRIQSETGMEHTVYLFSDDADWALRNLNFGCNVIPVVHNNRESAWEDLRLMSSCRHQVISNSTFSWWAAWLNRNPAKLIFAPQFWFRPSSGIKSDIVPESWNRIENRSRPPQKKAA